MMAFACAVLTSAFLIFQVQPVIARFILPWFGGSPAVWTTCMLFFQLGLLGGYSYAHLLVKRIPLSKQPYIHLALLIASMVVLPIVPEQATVTAGDQLPMIKVLLLLLTTVGFPFVVLSASAPLLQHWFAHAHPGKSPYRLYALSNFGSLVALLSYPFLIEPALSLTTQTTVWSIGYVIFAGMTVWCSWPILRSQISAQVIDSNSAEGTTSWLDRITWTLLAACGSVVLLATTNQMSQDVAVIPFLWVLPLSFYLISFIICFERDRWYVRPVWVGYFILSTTALVYLLHQDYAETEMSLAYQIAIYTSAMFSCCMICHGEMVRRRPSSQHLTTFYLYVALGGALGGITVSVIAPLVFNGFWELHLSLVAVALIAGWFIITDRKALNTKELRYVFGSAWAVVLVLLSVFLIGHFETQRGQSIYNARGFYGVLHVYEINPGYENHVRALSHGRIHHGQQWFWNDNRKKPTAYYGTKTGAGLSLTRHPNRYKSGANAGAMKVGVIGLGVGTVAAYGQSKDEFKFYEINSQIEDIAKTHFTYLVESKAKIEVIIGDGRISLAEELKTKGSQQFDVLVIDAFSGDAIPIHLLTREAMDLYMKHLKPDGIIAIHVTNIHVDLFNVARQLAKHANREAIHIHDRAEEEHEIANDWVLITKNRVFLTDPAIKKQIKPWSASALPVVWTDDFSNLFEAIAW